MTEWFPSFRFPVLGAGLRALRRHWIPLTAAYALWVGLVFGVEGVARYNCRVPGQDWIGKGADARERLERNARYNRGAQCLEATRWHSEATEMLESAAVALPCLVLAAYVAWVAREPSRRGLVRVFDHSSIAYAAVFTGTLTLAFLPYLGAMLFFQHYGFAGP